jgi:NAD(P)-dependent dehydrogenase (short-subunit alcohol dehydrogenase family)
VSTDLFDLRDHVAVVSGGGGWLGSAMVATLASAGAHVISIGRDLGTLEQAVAQHGLGRNQVTTAACDVTTDEWPELLHSVGERFERIDVLVNNAYAGASGPLGDAERSAYLSAMDLVVVAASEGMRAALPGFDASRAAGGSPSVVNVASMYGLVAPDPGLYASDQQQNPPYYGAAKAGLLGLTRYAAAELGPRGVRVNALSPGPFPGPTARQDQPFVDRLGARTMVGRVGNPEDLATALLFLASSHSRFVTGSNVVVDGGWTAW